MLGSIGPPLLSILQPLLVRWQAVGPHGELAGLGPRPCPRRRAHAPRVTRVARVASALGRGGRGHRVGVAARVMALRRVLEVLLLLAHLSRGARVPLVAGIAWVLRPWRVGLLRPVGRAPHVLLLAHGLS